MMAKPKYEHVPLTREDRYGPLRLMTIAEGHVMGRRKGGAPFVVTIDEWVEIGADSQVVPMHAVTP